MCISMFYAQVLGLWLFFVALAMLAHGARFKKAVLESISNPVMMNCMGFVTLGLGILVIITHNIWVSEWPVLITLIGWFLGLQGLFRLFYPGEFGNVMKKLTTKNGFKVMTWVWLLLGAYLIWTGFIR